MLFDNVIEQIQASKKEEAEVVIVKLGEVTSVTPGGRAYVKLYGDGSPSTKLYTYIDGYFPEQGDKVALLPQGKTYIILGKVNDENPVEIYAKIKWVEENFCPIEYKSIIEDASNPAEDITFGNYALLPTTDDKDSLGSSAKNFKEIFIKKLTLDGESFTKIYQDRIFVVNSGTTYSLIATYAAGTITLTPSTNDAWALGTSAAKLKEIWTGLFRGAWKSGQSTERELAWNASNALVPDSSEAVDLGSSSLHFKDLYIRRVIGAFAHDNTNGYIVWDSATVLAPSANNSIELGSAAKQYNKVYTKSLYLNGTEFIPANITVDKLHTTYGQQSKDLTLSADANGVHILPNVNNQFKLGSASYKFAEIFATKFTGDLDGKLKDGNDYTLGFDSAHDLIPSATNAVSLGTSSYQYNKVYTKELYLNGTKFDPSGTTTNSLVDNTGGYSRTLALTSNSTGADILPSVNNTFKLGSSSYKFSEIFSTKFTGNLTGNLTGSIKDGSSYNLSFDSSHNLIPDTSEVVSLGTSSKKYDNIYAKILHGLFDGSWKDGNYSLGFDSSHNLVPSVNEGQNLGTALKQFGKIYAKEIYINGTLIDVSGITTDKLVAVTGTITRNLTMTATNTGANIIPSVNNTFDLGSSSYKFNEVNASYFNGTLDGPVKIGNYTLSIDGGNQALYPSTDNIIALGGSSNQFKAGYFKKLYLDGSEVDLSNISISKLTAVNGSYSRTLTLSANSSGSKLLPGTNNTYQIGEYSTQFKEIFAYYFCGALRNYTSSSNYQSIEWDNSHNFYPSTTNTVSLGTSNKQFKNIYGQNIYVNGTAVSSDRRKKDDIAPLDWRYKEFFKSLNPVSFRYKDGTSGRKHIGFIAQEVEEAATKAGLSDKDIAVVVKDPEGSYYLRYEEIIAVQTEVIQQLMAKVETLEAENKRLESKVSKAESRLEKIEKFLFN